MIVGILYLIAGTVLNLVHFLLSGLTFVIPEQFIDGIAEALSYVANFQSIFPVQTLLLAITSILTFWLVIYSVRIILWIIGFIPTINNTEKVFDSDKKNK